MIQQVRVCFRPVSLFAISLFMVGCDGNSDKSAVVPLPQVTVHTVVPAPLTVTTELPGRTSASRIAQVRPQVSGIVLKRNFAEGSTIQAGESLYQIDPATYQAAWESAKGNLAKARAAASIARLTVQRYLPLAGTNYISQQENDQAIANARQADASVVAAQAELETARINLAYTKVTSPIGGRIGKSSVTEGALVQNGQSAALATVQQLDPVYVDVTQSSTDFLRLKQAAARGALQNSDVQAGVTLILDNGQPYPLKGTLAFSDITVDESTGSITLRAIFPNPDGTLLPGMFVRARVEQGIQPGAILVPQQGLTRTPRGEAIVMLVNTKNQVESKTVEASQAIGNDWLIEDGLKPGDRVIVSGLQKIHPGDEVNPTSDTVAKPEK